MGRWGWLASEWVPAFLFLPPQHVGYKHAPCLAFHMGSEDWTRGHRHCTVQPEPTVSTASSCDFFSVKVTHRINFIKWDFQKQMLGTDTAFSFQNPKNVISSVWPFAKEEREEVEEKPVHFTHSKKTAITQILPVFLFVSIWPSYSCLAADIHGTVQW